MMFFQMGSIISKMNPIRITDRISYIPATEPPLSADVGIVEGGSAVYFFDVGSNEEVAEFIKNYDAGLGLDGERKKKIAVISHFHTDHTANLTRIEFDKIYLGKTTLKYFSIIRGSQSLHEAHETETPKLAAESGIPFEERCEVVTDKIEIEDGIKITIGEIPSSHSKGSVYMLAGRHAFLGDATFYGYKREKKFYNAQLLQQELAVLKELDADFFMLSHRKHFAKQKRSVMSLLEQIYKSRKQNESEIEIF